MTANRMCSARGQSSSPPASTGRMSRPGENHASEIWTAATLMNTVTSARPTATRRLRVMNWWLTQPLALLAAERAASRERDQPGTTMMAALYRPAGRSGTCARGRMTPSWPVRPDRRWRLPRRGGRNSGMASPYPIRPATEDDLLAVSAVHEHAFHTGPPSGLVRERLDARIEYDRTFVASDGGTIVGTTGSYSFRMRVPGALAAVAGVTLVGCCPRTGAAAFSPVGGTVLGPGPLVPDDVLS